MSYIWPQGKKKNIKMVFIFYHMKSPSVLHLIYRVDHQKFVASSASSANSATKVYFREMPIKGGVSSSLVKNVGDLRTPQ